MTCVPVAVAHPLLGQLSPLRDERRAGQPRPSAAARAAPRRVGCSRPAVHDASRCRRTWAWIAKAASQGSAPHKTPPSPERAMRARHRATEGPGYRRGRGTRLGEPEATRARVRLAQLQVDRNAQEAP